MAESPPIQLREGPVSSPVARQCAEIHAAEIPDGFLPSLGPGFLTLLYRFFSAGPKTFLVVASRGETVLGFLCGSLGTGGVYRDFLKRHGVRASALLLPSIVRPGVAKRIIETLRYPDQTSNLDLPDAEILNFCVSREAQGLGVGRQLMSASCAAFRQRGVAAIRIVTGESQRRAQSFYEHSGASLAARIRVHDDSESRVYRLDLAQGAVN